MLFAIVVILLCFYISSTAANPAVILISSDTIYPEIIGRIPDEDKNFTGSVKVESGTVNITNIIGRIPDEDKNFTGSVKEPNILNITKSQLNMSLVDAASKAEGITGNDSIAVDAKLATRNGYLVYEVLLLDNNSDKPFTWLIIDPHSEDRLDTKMVCKCDECKQFGEKWICTVCKCTSG
ncbi:MAG TPA: hypothetical protein VJ772_08185 [Nitrososphaeraceae archaeon]|nr:hypothetical protein [Nitrososphaeraceae archaeon]